MRHAAVDRAGHEPSRVRRFVWCRGPARARILFGYVTAIIAGFLLTAIPNWTGRLPVRGSVPLNEILWLAAMIVAGGVITGLLAGLFDVGGGSVIVPLLFEVFRVLGVSQEVRMQLCVGTSIAIILPTVIRSYRAHRARGLVIPGVIRMWALPAMAGVGCGAVIAAFAPAAVFTIAFVVLASFIACKLLFASDRWNLGSELPGPLLMLLYGFGVRLGASLIGVSGGALSTIVLTLYGKSIHGAVATSVGIGVPITIAGTIGFILAGLPHQALLSPFSLGFVSVIGLVLMALVSSLVAPYGARLAHQLSRRMLEIAFGCFLLLVSLRFLVSLI